MVVYANSNDENLANSDQEKRNVSTSDVVKPTKKPYVSLDENPFYHKEKDKDNKKDKNVIHFAQENGHQNLDDSAKTEIPPYLGPIIPNYQKPSKNTKPTPKIKPKPSVSPQNENYIPINSYPQQIPVLPTKAGTAPPSHVHIHSKGNPEEILHIINSHPEIANYPHGSVLEIHNIPNTDRQKPPYLNPNSLVPQQPPRQQGVLPYVVPGDHTNIPLPPGVTLEQLLQEIHKTEQSSAPYNPYQQNGQIFITPQSGAVIPTRNSSYQGGWC